jgi:hypothetical protein
MKKIFFIIALVFVLTAVANSQINTFFGFKLGVTVPNVAVSSGTNSSVDVSNKYGIYAGVFAEIPVIKRLSIVSEIGYEQKNISSMTKYSSSYFRSDSIRLDAKSDYLSYLIRAKYIIYDGSVKPYCTLGLSVNAFLGSSLYGTSSNIPDKFKIIANDGFKRFNYCPSIGAGCDFTVSSAVSFLTELNFALPTDSYFKYEPYSLYARSYTIDFKAGLKF